MDKVCQSHIALLEIAADKSEIHTICTNFCHGMGFEYFLYGVCIPTSLSYPNFLYITNYSADWRAHYNHQSYMSIDPTVIHCFTQVTPLHWKHATRFDSSKIVKQFMDEAANIGLKNGISFPLHNTTGETVIFSLASENKFMQQVGIAVESYGQLFTGYLHEAVKRIYPQEFSHDIKVQLTPREKECLIWSADGKTSWEISQILSISERTVIYHIQNVVKKLGVTNRQHAIAKAITSGVVQPFLE